MTDNDQPLNTQPLTHQERADFLFDCVSDALRDHKEPDVSREQAVFALRHADRMFQALHDWIMSGRPLPSPWATSYVPVPTAEDTES